MAVILPQGHPLAVTQPAPRRGRPLDVVLINLMPFKLATEEQFIAQFDGARHDVRLSLVAPPDHVAHHTDPAHMERFYTPWQAIAGRAVDGVIVTGAPVEHLPFAEVDYWPWFRDLVGWAGDSAGHSLFICWAAQAVLQIRHGIAKRPLPAKAFGVHRQTVLDRRHPLMAGLPAELPTPVSRHTEVAWSDIVRRSGLSVVAASTATGLAIVDEPGRRTTCMFNHIEYDARTLHDEYFRDRGLGRDIGLPHDYYRNGVLIPPHRAPWRDAGRRLFANWLDVLDGLRQSAPRERQAPCTAPLLHPAA